MMFLEHFYKSEGKQLSDIKYFDAFEEKPKEMLVLGLRFHPRNFAAPFGHEIAWGQILDTVVFQSFNPSKFPRIYNALMINTRKIDRIDGENRAHKCLQVLAHESLWKNDMRLHESCKL